MDWQTVISVVMAATGTSLLAAWETLRTRKQRARDVELQQRLITMATFASHGSGSDPGNESLDDKLSRIHALSKELDGLNREVDAAFAVQIAATKRAEQEALEAREKADRATLIASLREDQVKATKDLIAAELGLQLRQSTESTRKSERRFQVLLASAFFLLGGALSIGGTLLVQALAGA